MFISVDQNKLNEDNFQEVAWLCQQLYHHLQVCMKEVHQSLIPCAAVPVAYLECPLNHEGALAPHLALSEIESEKDLICPKSGKVVPLSYYNLLFASPNHRK